MISRDCPDCEGSGRIYLLVGEEPRGMGGIQPKYSSRPCPDCGGRGLIEDPEYGAASEDIERLRFLCRKCGREELKLRHFVAEAHRFWGNCQDCGALGSASEEAVNEALDELEEEDE